MARPARNIVVIDDDMAMELLAERLRFQGHEARRLSSAAEALDQIDTVVAADLIVLDIIMSWPDTISATEMDNARTAGMQVMRQIRARNEDVPVIAYSATQDRSLIDAINADPRSDFCSKWEGISLADMIALIHRKLGVSDSPEPEQPFIVHGHDDKTKLELKNFLQNKLGFREPIVLHEQPSLGRTIIEKFEDNAAVSTIVFVLLTPDDIGASVEDSNDKKRRARQNVIFEMGYFLGSLGRLSGRVVLLHRGPIELPSDLSGVIYIDITGGIEAAGEQIRNELQNVIN